MHNMIFKTRPDVNAIIHTHATFSTAFCVTKQSIPPIIEDFVQIVGKSVDCAEYALPGTPELAVNAVKALGKNNAVLLVNHGTLCVGNSIDFAFTISDVVERAAYIYILSKTIGDPHLINDKDILFMQDFAKNKYGQKK
jgi:L-fuculose-phosphate aldolase